MFHGIGIIMVLDLFQNLWTQTWIYKRQLFTKAGIKGCMHVINGLVHEVNHHLWRLIFWIRHWFVITHRSQIHNRGNLLLHTKKCFHFNYSLCLCSFSMLETKKIEHNVFGQKMEKANDHVFSYCISNPRRPHEWEYTKYQVFWPHISRMLNQG